MPKVGYVAYIDESGDDGIREVRPIDPDGASEWFVLSAAVVRAEAQKETVWVRGILSDLNLPQRRHLHFQDLDDRRRLRACQTIADLPLRCFAVLSNKRNMRGYTNPNAAKVYSQAPRTWFYWWITRLLLERVTDFCERRALRDYGETRLVRLEFARRGGLYYSHFQSYLYWLRMQSKADTLFLKQGDLRWSVIDAMNEVRVYDPAQRAGLQIADTIAGAFYQGVTANSAGTCEPSYAMALEPRMGRNREKTIYGYGVKLMPTSHLWSAPAHQKPLLRFYAAR